MPHGLLRAGEDDGLVAVLDQVRKRRGGVGHGIRAVQQHKAVVGIVAVHNDVADTHPILRAHVGAVDIHGLDDIQLAHSRDLRYRLRQLLTRKSGGEAVAVLCRSDGAAGGDEQDVFHCIKPFLVQKRKARYGKGAAGHGKGDALSG